MATACSVEMPSIAAIAGRRSSRISGVSTMPGTKENTATPDSFADLPGHREGHRAERHLGPRVGHRHRRPLVRDHVDDDPPAALEHAGEEVLDRQERCAGVGRERLLPLRKLEVHERRHRRVQGVVDQDVDLAERRDRLRDHGHQLVDDAEVALDELRLAAGGPDGVRDGLPGRALVHDHDPGADGRHRHGDTLADATGPAGHQRGLPGQGGSVQTQPVDEVPVDGVHATPEAWLMRTRPWNARQAPSRHRVVESRPSVVIRRCPLARGLGPACTGPSRRTLSFPLDAVRGWPDDGACASQRSRP